MELGLNEILLTNNSLIVKELKVIKYMELVKLDINKFDVDIIAGLIYETDVKTFDFYFKDKHNAVNKIKKLIENGNNSIGYENIYVVSGSGKQVYGILVVSIGQEESIKENFKLYFKIFNWTDAFKMVLLDIVDMWFGAKLNEDDLYLATVAVEYKCRGKGVGKFILKKSMELAHKKGCKRVFLDVDRDNIPAFNLYKQFGFKIFSKKIIPWFGGIKGIYNMEYKLNRGDKG